MKKELLNIGCIFISLFLIFTNCSSKKNVLIIGDSISLGYTPFVETSLAEEANVVHNYKNAKFTQYGLDSIYNWLGETKWDVIHFNFGLHDLCYRSNPTNRDKIKGHQTTPLDIYERNMEKLIVILKETGAELIFATTTMVPSEDPGRYAEDVKYNRTAKELMRKYNIPVNDLYQLSLDVHPKYGKGNNDVHYSKEGYELLSKPVIEMIKSKF